MQDDFDVQAAQEIMDAWELAQHKARRQARFDRANLDLLARMGDRAFGLKYGREWLAKLQALRDAPKAR